MMKTVVGDEYQSYVVPWVNIHEFWSQVTHFAVEFWQTLLIKYLAFIFNYISQWSVKYIKWFALLSTDKNGFTFLNYIIYLTRILL